MDHIVVDLHYCSTCHHVSSDLILDKTIYNEEYLQRYEEYETTEMNEKLQELRMSFVNFLTNSSVLDYGCGSGAFVKYLEEHGIKATGFDINPYSKYSDIEILLGQRYDVLTMWDSLEHMYRPDMVIKAANPEILVVSTPDFSGTRYDLEHLTEWLHYRPREHSHYFSLDSLTLFFEKLGYRPYTISHDESFLRKGNGNKNIVTVGGTHV